MRIKVALYIVYISNLLNLNIREFKLFNLQKGNEEIQWIKVIYQDRILKNVLYLRNVHLIHSKMIRTASSCGMFKMQRGIHLLNEKSRCTTNVLVL